MADAKKSIQDLELAAANARVKQEAAQKECQKLERDMTEFKNNKEGKIDELKVRMIIKVYMWTNFESLTPS